MKKSHIVFVTVVIALWGGFMVYRHFKSKGNLEEHHASEHARITEAAKTSPRAGLAQMGSALQRYHDEKNMYPSSLDELYPKFVASKSFIDELDWYYSREGDNFFLSKTVVQGNKRMVASLDKSLRPRLETGVMVASPTPTPEPEAVEAPEVAAEGVAEISIQSREEFWEALRRRELDKTMRPLPQKRTSAVLLARRPKVTSVVESGVVSEAEREVSRRYLVWRDNNGTLGFGDAQFPATESRTIFDEGNWYDVTIPMPQEMAAVGSDTQFADTEADPEEILSRMDGRYLVWKGEKGTLGFGNIAYPQEERVTVFTDDDWVRLERPTPGVQTVGEVEESGPGKNTPEAIASKLSAEYLVWKDQETLGFSNVAYPRVGQVSAYEEDGWIGMERPALPPGTGSGEEDTASQGPSPEVVPPEISTRYLVWKDEQGNLGFGNVVYPDGGRVSAYEAEGWIGMERPALPPGTDSEKGYATPAPESLSPEAVSTEISTRYLVWKDEQGNLGFGNVVYPGTRDVSYVHVDGNWEKIMN
jgi:hypothetical protein